jgi:hypothetical protein
MKTPSWLTRGDAWPRPDFLPARRRADWVWWLAAACAGLALGVAWSDWHELDERITREQDNLQRLQHRAAPRVERSTRQDPAAPRARDSASRIATAVGYPWPKVMWAVERATPEGVRWLSFSHASADTLVRMEGDASRTEDALAVVDRLAAEPGWSQVVMTRLEASDARAAGRLRFELSARIRMGGTP